MSLFISYFEIIGCWVLLAPRYELILNMTQESIHKLLKSIYKAERAKKKKEKENESKDGNDDDSDDEDTAKAEPER